MNKKKSLALSAVLAVAVVLFIGWNLLSRRPFRYAGTVEATDVDLSPRVSSTISTVTVHEGDAVVPGRLLIELGCEDLKLAASIAASDFARSEKLYKEGSTPFETFDRDRNRRDATALQVSWCRIESPIPGTVLARMHEPGEYASPGMKILTLADLSQVYAYIYVPQTVLYRLKPGQAVSAFLPESGGAARGGTIAFIRPEAEFTPKNVQTQEERTRLVYGVKVALDNEDRVLKPGMPIEVELPR
ncbi:MAG TPA: efflux RND transporter periplasmic adaptor subunit [Elusimicrobiota bacterium]|jgi:HlyD family secretion protein|nr:efflux RND transporter periplasmic adaptor subunit [Elusimicrobiota bacterium]